MVPRLSFNEGKVCDAVIQRIETREGAARRNVRSPERERHPAPVELWGAAVYDSTGLHMPKALRKVGHFLHVGWRIVTEVHTASWLIMALVPSLPALLISGIVRFFGEHSALLISLSFVISFCAVSLLSLGAIGYYAETAGYSGIDTWNRIHKWWVGWLVLGMVGGFAISLWAIAGLLNSLSNTNDALAKHLNYLTADRHLTQSDIKKLAQFQIPPDGTTHQIIIGAFGIGCADCGGYADDFVAAFTLAKWNAQRVNYPDLNPAIKGVHIVVHDKDHIPRDAIAIKNALDNTVIRNEGINIWDYVKEGEVQIIVMSKPYD